MWPESSSANAVNLVKKYSSRDIEFFLGDYFFWRALYMCHVLYYGSVSDRHCPSAFIKFDLIWFDIKYTNFAIS